MLFYKKVVIYFTITIFVVLVILIKYFDNLESNLGMKREQKIHYEKNDRENENKVIVWWSPISGLADERKSCGIKTCLFSRNRNYFKESNIFLFYGSSIEDNDFPLPRKPNDIWILLHEESPKNVPFLMFESALKIFNYTSTFSRFSNVPLTLNYLESLDDIKDSKYFKSVHEKNRYKRDQSIASIVYIQSICTTFSNRDEYVKELGRYIGIDSYGKCLNNQPFRKNLSDNYLSKIFSDEFYEFISNYKFIVAFENSGCEDYITEKLWRSFKVGIVPIYFGSPSVKDWIPNEQSIIDVRDFETPRELADFIKYLDANDEEYKKYLSHKYRGIITNERLLNYKFIPYNDFITELECFVCENYEKMSATTSMSNQSHYACSIDDFMPKCFSIDILDTPLAHAACKAQVFHDLMVRNKPFTRTDFYSEILTRFKLNLC